MAKADKQKSAKADVKIGHALTRSAASLLADIANLRQVSSATVLESGIRHVFDSLPSSHRDALSTLLRAKGLSLRDLRKIDGSGAVESTPDLATGQGPSAPPPSATTTPSPSAAVLASGPSLEVRTNAISNRYLEVTGVYDDAIASMKSGE